MASNEVSLLSGVTNVSESIFTTIKGSGIEERRRVFQAVQSATPIADMLGKVIKIADIVVQRVEITNDDGSPDETPRVVLLTDDGKAYAGLSSGLLRSVENILGIMGQPEDWGGPLAVKVTEKRGRSGFRFYTLDLA